MKLATPSTPHRLAKSLAVSTHARALLMPRSPMLPKLTIDPFSGDREDPTHWMDREGFFVLGFGRWREMGWVFGQAGFSWPYTRWLQGQIDRIQRRIINEHG